MKTKIVEFPTHTSSPPHCCIISGRTDGPVIDFGDLTAKACGPSDPRVYIRVSRIEDAVKEHLGLPSSKEFKELKDELVEANAEAGRLRKIVAGTVGLEQAEGNLRGALESTNEMGSNGVKRPEEAVMSTTPDSNSGP